MQFRDIDLIIQQSPGLYSTARTRSVRAKEGVGTGLAYWHNSEGYALTHMLTGYALSICTVQEETQAQAWLAAVAKLYDWTQAMESQRLRDLPQTMKEIYHRILTLHREAESGALTLS